MLTGMMFFIGFFLIFLFGYKLSWILLPRVEKLEQISLGYILGIGIFTFIWFLLNWMGIPYNLMNGLAILLSLNIILCVVDRVFYKTREEKSIVELSFFKKLNMIEKFLLGIIVFLCISALVQNIYWPIRSWDSLVLYDFRAKIFAQTGFMQEAIAQGYFFSYPLLTSLAHTWVYLLGGTNPSFLYGFYYISLLIILYSNFKKLKIGRIFILLLTVLVAISPRLFDHTQWAYTNLPYSIYIVLSSIYLYFGIKKKDFGAYIISALLIGLSTWTRMAEPFWLSCVIIAIASSLLIKKWLWPFLYISLVGLIMLCWKVFQLPFTVVNTTVNNKLSTDVVNQISPISPGVVQNFQISIFKQTFNFIMTNVVEKYLIYFIFLGIILIIKLLTKSKEWFFVAIIFIDLVFIFIGTLVFVNSTPYWQDIPDSLSRMVMFIPALVIFLSAELLSEMEIG